MKKRLTLILIVFSFLKILNLPVSAICPDGTKKCPGQKDCVIGGCYKILSMFTSTKIPAQKGKTIEVPFDQVMKCPDNSHPIKVDDLPYFYCGNIASHNHPKLSKEHPLIK